jgi:hypothetical protein
MSEIEGKRFDAEVYRLIDTGQPVRLHFGCGDVPRPGFLNIDANRHPSVSGDDYFVFSFADVSWGIPDNSVDYIFHEDFIEHLNQLQQIQFLAETLRVLKPNCYHRINTPCLIGSMKRHSHFREGFQGVYTGEVQWGHISLFSRMSLKELSEVIGYSEIIFTTKDHGVSPYAVLDTRPHSDRDIIIGNIYADLKK